jgi:hypothetical protein
MPVACRPLGNRWTVGKVCEPIPAGQSFEGRSQATDGLGADDRSGGSEFSATAAVALPSIDEPRSPSTPHSAERGPPFRSGSPDRSRSTWPY